MKPRQPTASLSSGTSYDRTAFYDLPLTYDFTITNGNFANRTVATASTKPRPVPTATMKAR